MGSELLAFEICNVKFEIAQAVKKKIANYKEVQGAEL